LRRLNLILLAIALIFLIWILNEVGWSTLGRHLIAVGWYFPLILIPYGVVNWLEAISWKYLLPPPVIRPTITRLFILRLGGEALNQLTPSASLGGEAFKAARLQAGGVPWEDATASVVIHKGILVLSLALYIFLGLALAPFLLSSPGKGIRVLLLAAMGLAGAGLLFVFVQRHGPCGRGIRFLKRRGWCPQKLAEKEEFFTTLDERLASFYRNHPGPCALALTLFFLSWVMHGVEVYLMFWLLGSPLSWAQALALDALAMLITSLAFFIPAAVGAQEGGNILLALGFNLGVALGAAFSILRRLREAFWLILGLIIVARER